MHRCIPATYLRNPATYPGFPNDTRYSREYSTPRGYALYTGMMVYLHDQLYVSALYDDTKTQVSNLWRRLYAGQNSIIRTQFFNLALIYTPNPAIVLGAEYSRTISTYAQYGGYTYYAPNTPANTPQQLGTLDRKGTQQPDSVQRPVSVLRKELQPNTGGGLLGPLFFTIFLCLCRKRNTC